MLRNYNFFLESQLECRLSPVVVMSILNHYQRRPTNNDDEKGGNRSPDFVAGCLFGRKKDNIVYISDSFPTILALRMVIDDEGYTTEDISANADLVRKAVKLHKQTNSNDIFIGWYKTGNKDDACGILHEFFNNRIANLPTKVPPNSKKKPCDVLLKKEFVLLNIDTSLVNNKLDIRSYNVLPIINPFELKKYNMQVKKAKKKRKKNIQQKQTTTTASNNVDTKQDNDEENLDEIERPDVLIYKYIELGCKYYASEAEKIGIDMIINAPPDNDKLDSPAELMNDMFELDMSLQELLNKLKHVTDYVDNVCNGNIDGNRYIGWAINETLSCVPQINPAKFEEMLSTRLQDLLMLVYLGKLTKAQCTISDKINNVLHKTIPQ